RQRRFAEAESLLDEQRGLLTASRCPPRVLLSLEKRKGDVMARAGRGREALPILMSVASHSFGTAHDCADAACVAIGSGDVNSYRHLCAIGLARFSAGAEGVNALRVSDMLLAAPHDDVIIQAATDLVGRVEQARDFSKELSVDLSKWLEF